VKDIEATGVVVVLDEDDTDKADMNTPVTSALVESEESAGESEGPLLSIIDDTISPISMDVSFDTVSTKPAKPVNNKWRSYVYPPMDVFIEFGLLYS
jgi:hypothetical protein